MKLINFVAVSLALYGMFFHISQKVTEGFTLNQIRWDLPFLPSEKPIAPTPDNTLFNQKFYYLASGGQSFVFASADKKYVLKFFKNYSSWPLSWLATKKQRKKRLDKQERDFASYQLAFSELREEAALLYLHLNSTPKELPQVCLVDKLGIEHLVALDKTPFLLQKKGIPLYEHLEKLLEENNQEGVKDSLASLARLLHTRINKGIFDGDPKVHRNTGFIENIPILIDVGTLCKSRKRQTLPQMTERLSTWLEGKDPQLKIYLDHACKNL